MSLLKTIWRTWLKIGHAIGNFQAQVLFTIFYFVLLFPIGLALRFFSDSLNTKLKGSSSNFDLWEHPEEDLEAARKPY